MRVVIVGGGIGGLACAQGLALGDVDVVVVERDNGVSETVGYKLHLGAPSVQALRELLPPQLFELLLGSSVATRGFALVVRDHRGRQLIRAVEDAPGLTLDVDRITLREVLATGLQDRLMFGRHCRGWRAEGKTITVVLDDDSTIQTDVLVIADGAGSLLAEQLGGEATASPCGLTGIAGRSAWVDVPAHVRAMLRGEPMLALGPGGTGLFATHHDPAGRAAVVPDEVSSSTIEPVVIWGLLAIDAALPPQVNQFAPLALLAAAERLLRHHRWSTPLIELVRRAEISSVSAFRLNAANPERLAPWRSSRVTALGDAVHAMPPTGGQGAATAVLDARDLVAAITAAMAGEVTPVVAIHDYEARVRERGSRAVRESLEPVKWIRATATPAGGVALRAATPLLAAVAAAARGVRGRWR